MARFFTIGDTTEVDVDALINMLPRAGGVFRSAYWIRRSYIRAMLNAADILNEFGITTKEDVAHFIAQGLVETNWLRADEEGLYYTTVKALEIFDVFKGNAEYARQYLKKPKKLANKVYATRMGNSQPGDGYRFRGRGFIQLTGRNNYTRFAHLTGLDLVNDPDIIKRDKLASIRVAAAYWKENGLSALANAGETAKVGRAVNRGNPNSERPANHEKERLENTQQVLALLQKPGQVLLSDVKVLKVGSVGEAVYKAQKALKELGYLKGMVDGDFGRGTRKAVKEFQRAFKLPKRNGEIDADCMDQLMARCPAALDASEIYDQEQAKGLKLVKPAPTASPEPQRKVPELTIKAGADVEWIKAIQQLLAALSYSVGPADGAFGPKTEAAVKDFQASKALKVSGFIDGLTLASMMETAAIASSDWGTALSRGDHGALVLALQISLTTLGYDLGKCDGDYGGRTLAAVENFQKDYGLPLTGVADKETLARIKALFVPV